MYYVAMQSMTAPRARGQGDRQSEEPKMKIRSGKLIDRWTNHAGAWMAVQTPAGGIAKIRVRDQDTAEASCIWGGSTVRYVYRGGRPFYLPKSEFVAHI